MPPADAQLGVLQTQLDQAQTKLSETLVQLTAVQNQQAQHDTEVADLRTQLTALARSHETLLKQVGGGG